MSIYKVHALVVLFAFRLMVNTTGLYNYLSVPLYLHIFSTILLLLSLCLYTGIWAIRR